MPSGTCVPGTATPSIHSARRRLAAGGPSTSASHAPAQASRPSVSADAPERPARSPSERQPASRSATIACTSASFTPVT